MKTGKAPINAIVTPSHHETKARTFLRHPPSRLWVKCIQAVVGKRIQALLLLTIGFVLIMSCLNAQRSDSTAVARHATSLKVGFLKGHIYYGYMTLSCEREIGRHLSAQVDLGCFPFNRLRGVSFSFFGACLFAEARYYFALHRRPLNGLFIGPHIGANYNSFGGFDSGSWKRSEGYWAQVGATLGVQWTLFRNLSLGAGLKGGYSRSILARLVRFDGGKADTMWLKQNFSFFLAMTIGYKF